MGFDLGGFINAITNGIGNSLGGVNPINVIKGIFPGGSVGQGNAQTQTPTDPNAFNVAAAKAAFTFTPQDGYAFALIGALIVASTIPLLDNATMWLAGLFAFIMIFLVISYHSGGGT